MGLINRRGLGTQQQVSAPRRPGGGGGNRGNQGVQANRGSGGHGGGHGGGNRLPNTGLYHGDAGEAAANLNPAQFFRTAVSKIGGLSYSGTPISQFSEDFASKLLDDYLNAQASRQRLSPLDYLRKTYRARFYGKGGSRFKPGSLGLEGGALDSAYNTWYSNTDPTGYLTGQATAQGGLIPGGGNSSFQDFYTNQFIPSVQAQLTGAQASDPTLSMADYVAGRDLLGDARRRFLARPGVLRGQGPVNLGARWSWWE